MKKTILSVLCLTPLIATAAENIALIGDWQTRIENHSPYELRHGQQTVNEHGWLRNTLRNSVAAHTDTFAYQFSTNYLGQLSQTVYYEIYDHDKLLGNCVFHSGLGNYFANPDFTGSVCTLDDGQELTVSPIYKMVNDRSYEVSYRIGPKQTYSRMFVFGDSLSDDGNLYHSSGDIVPQSPPYFAGHFSDGKVWVEYLQDLFAMSAAQSHNYAMGSATSFAGNSSLVMSLAAQIAEYKLLNFSGDPYALYTLWIGANDMFAGMDDVDATVNHTLENVLNGIRTLAAHGAKTFLVPDLPNMAMTVYAKRTDKEAGDNTYSQTLTAMVTQYNALLNQALPMLEMELDVKIHPFPIYDTMTAIADEADKYGLTVLDAACNENTIWGGDLPVCDNPENYLFWDEIHPTTVVHKNLADFMFAVVKQQATAHR